MAFFALFWVMTGVFNIVISLVMSGPLDSNRFSLGVSSWTTSLVLQDTTLRMLLQAFSILQLFATYGLLKGSSWSYWGGLSLPVLDLAICASLFSIYYSAPAYLGLRTPLLDASLGVDIAFAGVAWVYLRRSLVKEYLTRWA
ncbi:MAG: hypothetical protein ABSB26_00665 [Nitrososphaerales archaeon]